MDDGLVLQKSDSGGLARDDLDAAMAPSRTRGAHGPQMQ